MIDMLERIQDMLTDELEKFAGKDKLANVAELDQLDKLTHALKSVKTTIAMCEGGYSQDSYARGRSMRTGRYISRDSYMNRDDGMGGITYPSDRRY